MNGALRVAILVALGVLVFGGAGVVGLGHDHGSGSESGSGSASGAGTEQPASGARDAAGHAGHGDHAPAEGSPAGEATAQGPLRLEAERVTLAAGRRERFAFRVVDRQGRTLRDFDVAHDRRMHLIAIRQDLTGFQHLHPAMADDGTWSTPLRLPEPGHYRVFADFKAGGTARVLPRDLHVSGDFKPRQLPRPALQAAAGDGYQVRLAPTGHEVRFTVRRGGRQIEDIEPYLGARGHLVALREGDLNYLHVHPESDASRGRDIRFTVHYPSVGRYRLFLQFKHDGRVRTAAFTQEVAVEHHH
ncbi:MAG TPA: hypothetical protein VEY90_05245 [Thermoleophilaceae bacterium]|jgi:hypothetical protein|nr:hypothetical protein [Thermoleophilaceae bacterium]